MHLTNVAIQKKSDHYNSELGGKWGVRELKLYMMSRYGREATEEAFWNVQQIVRKSLEAVAGVIINHKNCFGACRATCAITMWLGLTRAAAAQSCTGTTSCSTPTCALGSS